MALARGILVHLPLEVLVPLLWQKPTLLGSEPATMRAAVVNGLDRSQLQSLLAEQAGSLFETFDLYLKICTFQGELSEFAPLFIQPLYLIARAVELNDAAWFRYFAAFAPGDIKLETALQAGPEIQARALAWALTLRGIPGLLQIEDLSLVFRTRPNLRRWYLRYLDQAITGMVLDEDWFESFWFARGLGYLGWGTPGRVLALLGDSEEVRETYLRHYIVGRLDRGESLDFQDIEPPEVTSDLVEVGYLPSREDFPHYVQAAMRGFQVQLLQPGDMELIRANDGILLPKTFTQQEIFRAQQMLDFCQAHGGCGPLYALSLRILGGQVLPPDFLRSVPEGWRNMTRVLMQSVAHPQVDLNFRGEKNNPYSSVLYDPVTLARELDRNVPAKILSRIFAQGRALEVRGSFSSWNPKGTPFETPFLRTTLNSVFMEYLAHYKKTIRDVALPALPEEIAAVQTAYRKNPLLLPVPPEEPILAPEDVENLTQKVLRELQAL